MVRFLDRATPPHIVTLILLAGISALNMSIFLPSLNAMADYFNTDYAIMQRAGIAFLEEPREEPYGMVVKWRDPFGNKWDLIERY